ncbi:RagB/SusD family nutrient uptake outer membrane protein [Chitinophaga qingshengii]|uniref:RagB/SusD family nutrient uptake outer membrane protein n=1 Tax=Chitinophaga qingshengii TaxID=1569794 RepID=A0ABR7TF76_9BACT|nr:RagB/SusD family nutrient uptake outer membrane protein [Chitinophaga qingshengii]MBC9928973.1 RagB/SusD family nutrient uptake outer membrane protein [Chitinophaga qingshengii]
MRIVVNICLLCVVVLTGGCRKYLDTKPYSFNTVENLYKTAADAELGLTGCYSILNTNSIQNTGFGETFAVAMPFMLSAGTDELVAQDGFTNPNYAPFGTADVSSQNETIRNNWFFLFAGINRINYLLEQVPGTPVNENRKKEIIGEGHFLRGLLYMYLAMEYGGVPVYRSSVQDPGVQRASLQEVYELVLADLQEAYQSLPARAGVPGRANKWSAAGYLAKVYAYLAACKKNNVGKELNFKLNSFDWVDAAEMYNKLLTVTTDITANSGYKLTARYDYLFRETTRSAQNEEGLFTVKGSTSSVNGNYNLWLFWQIPIGSNIAGGGYGWFRPTGEQFFRYHAADVRRTHNLTLYLDPIGQTEVVEGTKYFVPLPCTNPKNGNYCVGKFRYRDPATKAISQAWSDGDFLLLRYADILLLRAEALYYAGDETGARQLLNEVRTRAAATPADTALLTTAYFNADFMTELLEERSRELCFESWRRIDLIRFGKLGTALNGLSNDKGSWNTIVPLIKTNWKPYKIWFPIPKTEIELSPLEQNTGY